MASGSGATLTHSQVKNARCLRRECLYRTAWAGKAPAAWLRGGQRL
ncbi:hypothetical protein CSC17_3480 [Klebsiella oxytoca]|nr:hypothetical protein CSC17_3480 [Klebsiella oxytoca]